jgi:hypothetical protein
MGKGAIQEALGLGQYSIELDYGSEIKQKKIDALIARGTELFGELNAKQEEYAEKESELIGFQQEINVLIQEYSSLVLGNPSGDYSEEKASIDKILVKILGVGTELGSIQTEIDAIKAEIEQNEKDKAEISNIKTIEEKDVWCVDYTITSTNEEVATIEIPGENEEILIAPGARVYQEAGDGVLRARGLMSPEQAYFNAAILPGWQRWKPTYRKATVLEVNKPENKARILLDDERSSAQNLPVNFELELENVPIQYMTCNAKVFEPDDRVVVEFEDQDVTKPKIIGFVSNPKRCFATLNYSSQPGGLILGFPTQEVFFGEDGSPVTVSLTSPTSGFLGWSDGAPFGLVRQDTNVQNDITAVALIASDSWPSTITVYLTKSDMAYRYASDPPATTTVIANTGAFVVTSTGPSGAINGYRDFVEFPQTGGLTTYYGFQNWAFVGPWSAFVGRSLDISLFDDRYIDVGGTGGIPELASQFSIDGFTSDKKPFFEPDIFDAAKTFGTAGFNGDSYDLSFIDYPIERPDAFSLVGSRSYKISYSGVGIKKPDEPSLIPTFTQYYTYSGQFTHTSSTILEALNAINWLPTYTYLNVRSTSGAIRRYKINIATLFRRESNNVSPSPGVTITYQGGFQVEYIRDYVD